MARRSKYEDYVKPFLSQITEWIKSGATEHEISTALGISEASLNEYKKKYPELIEALRTGRQHVVLQIKAALYKRACGFEYEERRGIKKGNQIISTEVFKRYCPPDTTAAAMLLRNYCEDWRDKDSVTTDFKKQELEIKKALAEANNFDVDFKE